MIYYFIDVHRTRYINFNALYIELYSCDMGLFLRHSRVFPRSVGKPTFSKAYLACALCVNSLCLLLMANKLHHLCC